MQWLGDFPEDASVYIPFNTFDSNDPQASVTITNLVDADLHVHKDGGTTQIVTDGATIAIDFDGITGNHLATIDTSAHADYSVGSDYMVRMEGTTVDGATINAWIGSFSIENRFNEVAVVAWNGVALGTTNPLPDAAADAAGGLVISDAGAQDFDAMNTAAVRLTAARAQVLDDWINAGRLDNLLDAIPTTAEIVTAIGGAAIEDHDTQGNWGWAIALIVYSGPDGPGIYIDSGAANTNTVVGTDGTEINPVSTFAAARTLADALGLKIYYLEGNSDITLAATHVDWEFIGIGSVLDNIVNLGSQDVSRSLFRNLALEGTQGGAGRITARDCALQDPGAGTSTFHIFAERCGFVDELLIDTSNDNVFDSCYSLVAGTGTPLVTATGAAGTVSFRHHSGSVELKALSASHNATFEGIGNVVFNADCNVNATVSLKGIGVITDNTAGMSNLDEVSFINMAKINAEADTAISDAALATAANLATVDAVADGIQTDLSNATDGLGALKTLIDAVNTDLANGTDGLGALKTLIDTVNTDLSNGTDGLGALKTLIDTVNTDLSNGTDGLGALKALIDTLDTVADAIKVITDKFVFTVANQVDSNALSVSGTAQTAGDLAALISSLNNISSANVLTQANAALDTAIAELGVAVPTATPTVRTALILMYMALRNRLDVQTSGTDALEIRNDAGAIITKKLLTDGGADYSEAKMS